MCIDLLTVGSNDEEGIELLTVGCDEKVEGIELLTVGCDDEGIELLTVGCDENEGLCVGTGGRSAVPMSSIT